MLRLSVSCDSLDLVWSLTECKGEAKGTRSTVLALTEDLKRVYYKLVLLGLV